MVIKMLGMKIRMNNVMRIATTTILILVICIYPLNGQTKDIANLPMAIERALAGECSYQSDLISYYYNTKKNYVEAIKWCNILMENPSAKDYHKEYANRILGYCALDGTGMDKSIEIAITYLKRGVEYKGGSCALSLGRIFASQLNDSIASIKWYKKAAELENKTAAYYLGSLYEKGFVIESNNNQIYYPNVVKDISQALKFYEIYIKNMGYKWSGVPTNSKLLYKLAHWYYAGEGNIEKNYTKAFNYFNSAIECNENSQDSYKLSSEEEGNALWLISICYRFGRGIEKDELTARRYVKRAAEKGNEKAIALLEE